MSKEVFYKVERSARAWTYGVLSKSTKRIWVVAHGYGQLAEYFIKNFEHLDPEVNFVIAPEALSRAYIDGMTGRVGASWMTKDMREKEIEDYINFINVIFEDLTKNHDLSSIRVMALGFSQGAATISRWTNENIDIVETVCLWGGQPGNELFSSSNFNKLPIIFVIGNKDSYISKEMKQKLVDQTKKSGWSFKVLEYDGGHQLNKETVSFLETQF